MFLFSITSFIKDFWICNIWQGCRFVLETTGMNGYGSNWWSSSVDSQES
jgi:hypothetical protein